MKHLVLAEKPSVGRELARVLGCFERAQGYIEGPGHIVTWALGHLVELAQPAAYGSQYRRWSLSSLPMLPAKLEQEVIEQSADQFKVIESLLQRNDIDTVIIATDAGREGELVARWILEKGGWHNPMKRLWISSQTDSAIKEGFTKLKDSSLYDNLYYAAKARAESDWYVGMNVTRALTCKYDAKLSAGRVQTPTLALMTRIEDEIDTFSGSFYWTIRVDFNQISASWHDAEGSIRILEEERANAISKEIEHAEATVVSIESEEKREKPPLAYDLTELQRDANTMLSFSAKKTLDTLQRLYEVHKIVTYPRTDSRYITGDIVPTLPNRLRALERTPIGPIAQVLAAGESHIDEERFVQESKVTDHHAILPTEQIVHLDRLSEDERALWELVATRFVEVLSADYVYRSTKVEIEAKGHRFVSRFTAAVSQGFRDVARVFGRRDQNGFTDQFAEDEVPAVSILEGTTLTINTVRLRRNTTNPPERYTEATLLSAMEHAGRFVEDARLKRRLGGGLGTPATRADMIEKLIQNHYVDRDGKYLVATANGRELIRLVPELLKSPELTAQWEDRLAAIANGSETADAFIEDIKRNAADMVHLVATSKEEFKPHYSTGKTCPHCASMMMNFTDEKGVLHFLCQRLSCGYEEALLRRLKTPVKKVQPNKVVVKPIAQKDESVKKHVVVKKKPFAETTKDSQMQWEEYIEVIRPSKYIRYNRHEATSGDQPRQSSYVKTNDDNAQTVTFAELMAASNRRNERKKRK